MVQMVDAFDTTFREGYGGAKSSEARISENSETTGQARVPQKAVPGSITFIRSSQHVVPRQQGLNQTTRV